jgi:AraC-like DNA-binding protein
MKMNHEILNIHKFQFIRLVSFLFKGDLAKSKANFNDHSNLIHIINGSGKVFFHSEAYPLERGTVISLPVFVECHFEYRPGLEMLNVHYNMWDNEGEHLDDQKRLPLVFRPDYFDYCETILKEMLRFKALPPPDNFKMASMAHELVIKHYISNQLVPSGSSTKDERISNIYKMLKSPGCVKYDAKRMAKSCFLSVSQMNRKFKHYFKEPPRKFWEKNRFNNVCHALTETDKPLAEIANEFAFSYQSHFSKWFKNIAKTSPAEYRREHSWEAESRP